MTFTRIILVSVGHLDARVSHRLNADTLLGEPEIDEDTGYWKDYDSQCHAVPFEDMPEGYVHPCCDQHGNVPGCSNHAHRTSSQDAYMKRFKA